MWPSTVKQLDCYFNLFNCVDLLLFWTRKKCCVIVLSSITGDEEGKGCNRYYPYYPSAEYTVSSHIHHTVHHYTWLLAVTKVYSLSHLNPHYLIHSVRILFGHHSAEELLVWSWWYRLKAYCILATLCLWHGEGSKRTLHHPTLTQNKQGWKVDRNLIHLTICIPDVFSARDSIGEVWFILCTHVLMSLLTFTLVLSGDKFVDHFLLPVLMSFYICDDHRDTRKQIFSVINCKDKVINTVSRIEAY